MAPEQEENSPIVTDFSDIVEVELLAIGENTRMRNFANTINPNETYCHRFQHGLQFINHPCAL
ncbi:MAG: hypothetical protein H6555_01985 [Lewinellaceae bacterium]|nr:hypothetical protein [Lewinellaceae bacterium]